MRSRKEQVITVINRRKDGTVFEPSKLLITQQEHPEVYQVLARIAASSREMKAS